MKKLSRKGERRKIMGEMGGALPPPTPPRGGLRPPSTARFVLSGARMQVFPLQAFRIAVWIRNTGATSEQGGSRCLPARRGLGSRRLRDNGYNAQVQDSGELATE